MAGKSNQDDYGNENANNTWFYEQINCSARASHVLVPFPPGYERKKTVGTI